MEEAKKTKKLARYWLTKHITLQPALYNNSTTATALRALVIILTKCKILFIARFYNFT